METILEMDGCRNDDVEQVGDSVMASLAALKLDPTPSLITLFNNPDVDNIFFGILRTNLFVWNLVKQTLEGLTKFGSH